MRHELHNEVEQLIVGASSEPSRPDQTLVDMMSNIQKSMEVGFASVNRRLDTIEERQERLADAVKFVASKIAPEIIAGADNSNAPPSPHHPNPSPLPFIASPPEPPRINPAPPTSPSPTHQLNPRYIPGREEDTYLLGGNEGMVRSVVEYKTILREVYTRKRTATDIERARLLCLNLMKREVPKEELAKSNVTGNSRDENKKKCKIPQIDRRLLHAIFQQTRQQFPEFKDWYTDTKCKTVEILNDGCKRARKELRGQPSN